MDEEIIYSALESVENKGSHFFSTNKGIFVRDSSMQYLASRCNRILRDNGRIFAKREILESLIEHAGSQEYYLKDQDSVMIGYLFPELSKNKGFPACDGLVLPCRDYLLFGDPQMPGNIRRSKKHSCIATFNIDGKEYEIKEHAFDKFIERARKSETLRKCNRNEDLNSQRNIIRRMYRMLKGSVPVERRNSVVQTLKYNFNAAEYRTCHGWIFVIDKDNCVHTCYEAGKISEKGYKEIPKAAG